MSRPQHTVQALIKAVTGNISTSNELTMVELPNRSWSGRGLDAGGRIDLGTATTVDVLVKDATGVVLYNGTVTADTDVSPTARGLQAPLTVTTTNISNAAHTLTIYWRIRK